MSTDPRTPFARRPGVHLLSVGLVQDLDADYGRILLGRPCEITQAEEADELHAIQVGDGHLDLVVLGSTLTPEKLSVAARFIRRTWPKAYIVIVSATPIAIEDSLYDDRILPVYSRKILMAELLRILETHKKRLGRIANRWEC